MIKEIRFFFFFSWSSSCFLSFFLVFLIAFLAEFLFSYFVFFYKFPLQVCFFKSDKYQVIKFMNNPQKKRGLCLPDIQLLSLVSVILYNEVFNSLTITFNSKYYRLIGKLTSGHFKIFKWLKSFSCSSKLVWWRWNKQKEFEILTWQEHKKNTYIWK